MVNLPVTHVGETENFNVIHAGEEVNPYVSIVTADPTPLVACVVGMVTFGMVTISTNAKVAELRAVCRATHVARRE
jgi:hypothetical protein